MKLIFDCIDKEFVMDEMCKTDIEEDNHQNISIWITEYNYDLKLRQHDLRTLELDDQNCFVSIYFFVFSMGNDKHLW